MASSQHRSQVVCTCQAFGCALQTFINEYGIQQPGHLVAPSTHTVHCKKDTLPASAMQIEAVEGLSSTTAAEPVPSGQGHGLDHLTSTSDETSLNSQKKSLYALICILAAWLHLVCGLSVAMTSQVMKYLEVVVLLAINLGSLLAQAVTSPKGKISLPYDVRTAMNALSIEPTITHSICCPKCFASYSLASLPDTCPWHESPRSKPCNEPLWTTRST